MMMMMDTPALGCHVPLDGRLNFLCSMAKVLKRERVGPNMKDMEHDNMKHGLNFLHPTTIGVVLFLFQDVTEPSPRLLRANPREYLRRVRQNAGALSPDHTHTEDGTLK